MQWCQAILLGPRGNRLNISGRAGRQSVISIIGNETARTIAVAVLDDAHDEGEEAFTLHPSNAAGA